MIKVAVVEDNKNIREGLKILIDSTDNYSCVAAYPDCESMIGKISKVNPDILLMDIGLPGMNGIEGIREVKTFLPDLSILVITVYEENELMFDALCAGACGYVVKKTPPSKLVEAIKEVYDGGAPMSAYIARRIIDFFQKKQVVKDKPSYLLTLHEKEVLGYLIEGYSAKAISDSSSMTMETVRFHFRNIYKKLHAYSRGELPQGNLTSLNEDLLGQN